VTSPLLRQLPDTQKNTACSTFAWAYVYKTVAWQRVDQIRHNIVALQLGPYLAGPRQRRTSVVFGADSCGFGLARHRNYLLSSWRLTACWYNASQSSFSSVGDRVDSTISVSEKRCTCLFQQQLLVLIWHCDRLLVLAETDPVVSIQTWFRVEKIWYGDLDMPWFD
jgi:hypothetical protein